MTGADPSPAGGRRAVVLVSNPAAPYSRALRVARALLGAGYEVEIAACAGVGLPDLEHEGPITLHRYQPQIMSGAIGSTEAPDSDAAAAASARTPAPRRRFARLRHPLGRAKRYGVRYRDALLWPKGPIRAWWATLERELQPADVYHACGVFAVAPALAARRRAGADRAAVVVHDVVDDFFESTNVLTMPVIPRLINAQRERRWARSADAVLAVNDHQAARVAERWGLRRRPAVVANYPETVDLGDAQPNLLRESLGIAPQTSIVVFQGRMGPELGLEQLEEAILLLPDAALVLMGFGRWFQRLAANDRDPRWQGRHYTIPPRHPDELIAWTASADVAVVPFPPRSLNHRLATPNKFWEALMAGTPVVVPRELRVMAELIEREGLGAIADSVEPADLAAAITSVLSADPAERAARRARIMRIARERYSWDAAAATYREVVERATEQRDRRASGAASIAGGAR